MSEVIEYIEMILSAAVLAAFIIVFIVQAYIVQGSSMEPTLHQGARIFGEKVSYRLRKPRRGEIVVLKHFTGKLFIKRVIGIAGDCIRISEGKVYLNGNELKEPYIKEYTSGEWGAYVVPDDKLFVMGDNRNASDDSRFSVGYLDIRDVKAKAVLIFFPLSKFKRL